MFTLYLFLIFIELEKVKIVKKVISKLTMRLKLICKLICLIEMDIGHIVAHELTRFFILTPLITMVGTNLKDGCRACVLSPFAASKSSASGLAMQSSINFRVFSFRPTF